MLSRFLLLLEKYVKIPRLSTSYDTIANNIGGVKKASVLDDILRAGAVMNYYLELLYELLPEQILSAFLLCFQTCIDNYYLPSCVISFISDCMYVSSETHTKIPLSDMKS